MSDAATKVQATPQNGQERVVDFVIADLRERAELGKRRYGTYLQTHNGRNALLDAYQEALDLVMYLRQFILELTDDANVVDQMDILTFCAACGSQLMAVRPGKWQCPKCE